MMHQKVGAQVAGAARRTRRKHPRVMVSLALMEAASRATRSPQAFFFVWLLYLSWKADNATTFPLPSGQLLEYGIDRQAKRRALASLEKAGLIAVERPTGKTPVVTLTCINSIQG
jgi:hypothetical protein